MTKITKEKKNMEAAILKSAEKLFMEKGFAGASTTMIAKEAGCNQALVHYYFRTKDNLFDAIFEKKMGLFISGLLSQSSDHLTFEEKLTQKIEAHFDMIESNPSLPLFFFHEIQSNPQRLKIIVEKLGGLPQQILGQLEKELNIEIKAGRIRPISLFDLMLSIVSLNLMLFVGSPIIQTILDLNKKEMKQIVANRKKENVQIILKSLQA